MISTPIRTEFLSDTSVQLDCTLAAPPERVYRAWTEPGDIAQWFTPGPGTVCRVVKFDLSIGGGFELALTNPVGDSTVICTYTTLDPPKLVEFSFLGCCEGPEKPASHVSVAISAEGTGTRLVLTDQRIATPEEAQKHSAGWLSCLGGLTDYLSTR